MKIYKVYKSILVWGMLFFCPIVADELPLVLYNSEGEVFEVVYDDSGEGNKVWLYYEDGACDCILIGYLIDRRSVTWEDLKTFYRYLPVDNNTQRTDLFYFEQIERRVTSRLPAIVKYENFDQDSDSSSSNEDMSLL